MISAPPLHRVWPVLLTIACFTGFSATPVLRGDDIAMMRKKHCSFSPPLRTPMVHGRSLMRLASPGW
ncbi:MAG UNVERIFIED_CONTAM: hypothetical protein LVR18_45135 [Planctomycetaceae bacterium]